MDLGVVLFLFSKNVGILESNEAKMVAVLEALRFFASSPFQASLTVESDSLNVSSWMSSSTKGPWR